MPSSLPGSPSPTQQAPRRSILRPRHTHPITPLPLSLTQRIPAEVFEIIVARIASFDVPTLRVCSLVCKNWLVISRVHLIPSLSLNPRNTESFLRLLKRPHATIARGIRHVSVQGESDAISHRKARESRIFPVDEVRGASSTCEKECMLLLLDALAPFPSLISLSFSWMRSLSPTTNIALTRGFSSRLTDLEFRTCSFPSFPEFVWTLCALQGLRRLALADVTWEDLSIPEPNHTAPSKVSRPPSGLQKLELYLAPIGHICTWLAGHSDALVHLETLRLCSAFWEDADAIAIAWMLRRLGPRTLRISHLWFKPLEAELAAEAARAPVEEAFTARGVERTLSQLNSPCIRHVEFRILLIGELPNGSMGLNWDAIGRILGRSCFRGLQGVTFGLPGHDKKVRSILRRIWGVGKKGEDLENAKEEGRRRSKRQSGKKLTRVQVDEVFASKEKTY
ncbi:hypothetical protein DXG03_005917 [Asterophora parasitica]|uniref:F-box domain-containing protein n=1 Tax=Asterophora parasitica TaxID=117018 RepID=A0A9P7GEG2_9AGAR|nr:hypothetical protein DXG03_005917 [Asterophora parasitica]